MSVPILVAALVFAVSRKALNQYRIRTGRLQVDFLDPMPSPRALAQAYAAAGSGWRRHLKTRRTLETILFVALLAALSVLQGIYGSPLGSVILIAILLFELGVQWYQWLAVDLSLMARSWSWIIRDTAQPRLLEG